MKKGFRLFIVVLLALAIQFTGMGGLVAQAADITDTVNIITGVSLTDRDGNPLGENIAKDAELRLTYEFSIPNTSDVQAGDTCTIHIPNEILIQLPGTFEIRDDDNNLIGTGSLSTDGTIMLTFSDFPAEYSNVHGYFWFDLQFDEAEIGSDDPTIITFEVGGTSDPVTIEVDFDQPAPLPASVQKSGSFNQNTNEITWTITANPENVQVTDGQIVDVLPSGLEFVAGSVQINGADANPADYAFDGGTNTLTYNFPSSISTQQILTFRTTVADSEFEGANQGDTLQQSNIATFNHDDTSVDSEEATVSIPVAYISKTGTYVSGRKQIDWTITINQRGVSIPDAMLSDTLPDGLTLAAGTFKVDGVLSSGYVYAPPEITYSFGAISEPHTITFSTDVDPDFYLEYNNSQNFSNNAVLTGEGVPGNATDGDTVGVSSSLIRKQGVAYDRTTGQITWRVTVNTNQVNIQNAVVTDNIRIGQEYVSGSATIDNGADLSGFSYVAAAADDPDKTGTLTYTFASEISQTYVIEFKTQITDPDVFMGNASIRYYNTASLTGSNITETSYTGNRDIFSEINKKTGNSYDYVTREIEWKIVVNGNAMPLSDVVVTDEIPLGLEYVTGSAEIDNGGDAGGFAYTAAPSDDPDKTGTLTYTFPSPITETYTITFKTLITDLSVFSTNGDKTFHNVSSVIHADIENDVDSDGTETIRNTVIGKSADYTTGNKYIDWSISINTNSIPLENSEITDTFQQGLSLDTASIRLFHQTIDAAGNAHTGDEIALDASNVQYDFDTRTLHFFIPDPVSGSYLLTFRTNLPFRQTRL